MHASKIVIQSMKKNNHRRKPNEKEKQNSKEHRLKWKKTNQSYLKFQYISIQYPKIIHEKQTYGTEIIPQLGKILLVTN
jgi:hypothetical protein